ncbi:DUF4363 family protein [Clostridium sp. JNZ J1-5]
MKKFFPYLIPITAIAIFIVVMFSGKYLKKPRNPSEDVLGFVQMAMNHTKAEDWSKVKEDITHIDKAWKKVVPRIQFSVERDEIYRIGVNIARLKGGSTAQDKSSVLMELNELLENWDELTK